MRRFPLIVALLAVVAHCAPRTEALCQSPYRLNTSQEVVLLSSGVVAGVTAILVQGHIDPLSEQEVAALSRQDVNAFDRGATWNYSEKAGTASDYLVYGLIAAPPALLLDQRIRDDWQTFGVMYAEAMLLTGATVQLVKGLVARTRPYAYNPDAPLEIRTSVDASNSFYSSHTAFAFAAAVFLGVTYSAYFPDSRWRPWVWAMSLTAASAVGYLRFEAGEHFPTDILTGAVVGAAIGYLVPALHRVEAEQVSVSPVVGTRAGHLSVVLRF